MAWQREPSAAGLKQAWLITAGRICHGVNGRRVLCCVSQAIRLGGLSVGEMQSKIYSVIWGQMAPSVFLSSLFVSNTHRCTHIHTRTLSTLDSLGTASAASSLLRYHCATEAHTHKHTGVCTSLPGGDPGLSICLVPLQIGD